MYNKLCNICDYIRDNAKETAILIACVVALIPLGKAYAYIQNDHIVATVYDVETENNLVVFERMDGHLYDFKVSESEINDFEVGQLWQIDMFDFETSSPYDDEIVKINARLD